MCRRAAVSGAGDARCEPVNSVSFPPHSGAAERRRTSRRFWLARPTLALPRFLGRQNCENSLFEAIDPRRFVSGGDRDELGEAVQFGQTRRTKASIEARVGATSRRHVSP